MLAGVAQEVDQRQLAEPVEVVDHDRAPDPGVKSRNRSSCARIAADVRRERLASSRFRSLERPDGSPIIPVPPPTSATGRPPKRCSRSSPKIGHQVADVERSRRTGRSRCSRRSGGPVASRAGSPGVVAWRMPRHSSSASSPPRPVAASGASVTGVERRAVSTRPGGSSTVRSRPLCYRAATDADQPRAAPAPPTGAPGRRPKAAPGSIIGRIARRRPRRDPPHRRPRCGRRRRSSWPSAPTTTTPPACPTRDALDEHPVRAADDHLRPDRQDRARPPRRPQARARHLRPDPGRDHRRHDRDRGQGLLEQPRLRPGRASSRPASTPSPAGRAARRRSPSSSSAPGSSRPRRSRAPPTSARSREIIQSIRLTQAYPGRGRQAADHHRLPEPELLRQPELRREGRGQGLLRQVARPS